MSWAFIAVETIVMIQGLMIIILIEHHRRKTRVMERMADKIAEQRQIIEELKARE